MTALTKKTLRRFLAGGEWLMPLVAIACGWAAARSWYAGEAGYAAAYLFAATGPCCTFTWLMLWDAYRKDEAEREAKTP